MCMYLRVRVMCLFVCLVKPYLGAEKEGVLGFGKGMVKGVVGVAIKVRNPPSPPAALDRMYKSSP